MSKFVIFKDHRNGTPILVNSDKVFTAFQITPGFTRLLFSAAAADALDLSEDFQTVIDALNAAD